VGEGRRAESRAFLHPGREGKGVTKILEEIISPSRTTEAAWKPDRDAVNTVINLPNKSSKTVLKVKIVNTTQVKLKLKLIKHSYQKPLSSPFLFLSLLVFLSLTSLLLLVLSFFLVA
jgi:hypothetical protein